MYVFEAPTNPEAVFQKRKHTSQATQSTHTAQATHPAFQSLRHWDTEWRGSALTKAAIYGGILCAPHEQEIYYALVQGRHTGKWSFPKGHADEGEQPLQCALREIEEETGLRALTQSLLSGPVGYGYYFLFILPNIIPLIPVDTKEIMNTAWVTVEQMRGMNVNADVHSFLRS